MHLLGFLGPEIAKKVMMTRTPTGLVLPDFHPITLENCAVIVLRHPIIKGFLPHATRPEHLFSWVIVEVTQRKWYPFWYPCIFLFVDSALT